MSRSNKMSSNKTITPVTVDKFNKTSTGLSGNLQTLKEELKRLEADIKNDVKGKKEFEIYLSDMHRKRSEFQKRIDENKEWLAGFDDGSESLVQTYKTLLEDIKQIYGTAKECHSQGIDMLIRDFGYHVAYKRHNDTFSAIPFRPK